MAKVKLVAESIQEYAMEQEFPPVELVTENEELNKEDLNESLARKWKKLDKDSEEAVKKFAFNLKKDAKGDAGMSVIKNAIKKAKFDSLKQLLVKASEDGFKGYLRPSGKSFVYRPAAVRNVKSEFEGGGTQGKTSKGGV